MSQKEAGARDDTLTLSDRVASSLLAPSAGLSPELVRSVCELATDPDPRLNNIGQRLIFSVIAETLGDSFDASKVRLYDSIFSDVIEFCRHRPEGAELHVLLGRFGIRTRQDLVDRKARVSALRRLSPERRRDIRKAFILSRVTLGADMAVTSIVLQKVERVFPHAERVVVGPTADGLFAGAEGTRVVPQPYDKQSDLWERLGAWSSLVHLLSEEMAHLKPRECLIIDPDSRLTQLGLLPIAREEVPYFFFESRSYASPGLETMAELTEDWLNRTFGSDEGGPLYPRVTLRASDLATGAALVDTLRQGGAKHIVAVNLGVGGNDRKRIVGSFELDLVRSILARGSLVILDHGTGDEVERIRLVVTALRGEGRTVVEVRGDRMELSSPSLSPDLVTYRGAPGPYASLIARSDAYVGYDSAFQHIAAALGVPVIDIFVNVPNPLFPQRWRPHSRAAVRAIHTAASIDEKDLLADLIRAYQELRKPA